VKATKGSIRFAGVPAYPFYELGISGEYYLHDITKTTDLCFPAYEPSGVLIDPAMHYEVYKSKVGGFNHKVNDQFGTWNVYGGTNSIMVPTYTMLDGNPAPPPAGSADIFACAKAKFVEKFPKGIQVTVSEELETLRHYDVKKPKAICYPVRQWAERFANPQMLVMCYQVKLVKGEPKHVPVVDHIRTANTFGYERLDTSKQDMYCVPAKRVD
jgi:hypothetical protein